MTSTQDVMNGVSLSRAVYSGLAQDPRLVNDDSSIKTILFAAMGVAIIAGMSPVEDEATTSDDVLQVDVANEDVHSSSDGAYSLGTDHGIGEIKKSGQPDVQGFVAVLPSLAMVVLGLVLFYRLFRLARLQVKTKKGDSDKWL